ncbi:Transcriptional activator of proteases prtT [Apiospora hydei]|uniref:Transcriptional activator of proteases prtT n=1 Tax=Apiospora hydei TaxID=1337664 RepID=A0ABR1WDQ4_9PEZI
MAVCYKELPGQPSRWKQSMETKIHKLQLTVGRLAKNIVSPEEAEQMLTDEAHDTPMDQDFAATQAAKSTHPGPSGHWGVVMDLDSGPGAIPGFYIAGNQPPMQADPHEDFILRGVVTLHSARGCFDTYKDRLDHFPYRILNDQTAGDFESVRSASALLTASVCAVGALHSASSEFEAYYREFVRLSAQQIHSRHHTTDDVRALCIGAFWLSDLSWSLIGAAVRIATELQLHKSFSKALQGDRQHYLRARLYYLVYACDHRFSVAYGRPPMTRECEAVRNARDFLRCEFATEDDGRLVSQVLRWSICSNIFDTFGVDVDRPLSEFDLPHLRRFSIALDSIRAEWIDRFIPNAHVGNYPRKGVGLQYNFAKLYLCSHAFRGVSTDDFASHSPEVIMALEEVANSAVLAASAILRAVIADPEIQGFLDGLPTYFDTMIAFAAVLLKVSTKYSSMVQVYLQELRRLLRTLLATLKKVTSSMHQRHLLVSITAGLESLLFRCGVIGSTCAAEEQEVTAVTTGTDAGIDQLGYNSATSFSMEEYDFLFNSDVDFSLEFLDQENLV